VAVLEMAIRGGTDGDNGKKTAEAKALLGPFAVGHVLFHSFIFHHDLPA
jgi:hypothetical protein